MAKWRRCLSSPASCSCSSPTCSHTPPTTPAASQTWRPAVITVSHHSCIPFQLDHIILAQRFEAHDSCVIYGASYLWNHSMQQLLHSIALQIFGLWSLPRLEQTALVSSRIPTASEMWIQWWEVWRLISNLSENTSKHMKSFIARTFPQLHIFGWLLCW